MMLWLLFSINHLRLSLLAFFALLRFPFVLDALAHREDQVAEKARQGQPLASTEKCSIEEVRKLRQFGGGQWS